MVDAVAASEVGLKVGDLRNHVSATRPVEGVGLVDGEAERQVQRVHDNGGGRRTIACETELVVLKGVAGPHGGLLAEDDGVRAAGGAAANSDRTQGGVGEGGRGRRRRVGRGPSGAPLRSRGRPLDALQQRHLHRRRAEEPPGGRDVRARDDEALERSRHRIHRVRGVAEQVALRLQRDAEGAHASPTREAEVGGSDGPISVVADPGLRVVVGYSLDLKASVWSQPRRVEGLAFLAQQLEVGLGGGADRGVAARGNIEGLADVAFDVRLGDGVGPQLQSPRLTRAGGRVTGACRGGVHRQRRDARRGGHGADGAADHPVVDQVAQEHSPLAVAELPQASQDEPLRARGGRRPQVMDVEGVRSSHRPEEEDVQDDRALGLRVRERALALQGRRGVQQHPRENNVGQAVAVEGGVGRAAQVAQSRAGGLP